MTHSTSTPATTTAEQRTALALQRIEASRTQLILTLAPTGPRRSKQKAQPGQAGSANNASPGAPFAASLAAHMGQQGLGKGTWQALTGAATDWLNKQPWYASAELVGTTLVHEAQPFVRRHPWACLGAAAAAGAALAALRPWGWQPVQHRMAPWRSQVGSLVWGQLTQAPVQMALAGALAAWISSASASPRQSKPPERPDPPPAPEADATTTKPAPESPPSASAADARPASSPGVMAVTAPLEP
ncbi:hypothetical protein [Hydrogenophaga sp. PAMC20947]|uniref:hypothetical protein n=1 Tax=Hydrogenophaga sp. PAMC20947 TaxID=2565558 RepID=UPI00109DC2D0|nr:hypothetical protein [Hydrogenophaga sp. PAMC20947]QCB48350.1 hypothetical protein E5678_21380 [Hydrogenophaga sp. PAMC20947]